MLKVWFDEACEDYVSWQPVWFRFAKSPACNALGRDIIYMLVHLFFVETL